MSSRSHSRHMRLGTASRVLSGAPSRIERGAVPRAQGETRATSQARSGRHYLLECAGCGSRSADDGLALDCSHEHPAALPRTVYEPGEAAGQWGGGQGLYRFGQWLPIVRAFPDAPATSVYGRALSGRGAADA